MIKYLSVTMVTVLIFFANITILTGCSQSSISGEVVDSVTKKPLGKVKVCAAMKTKIMEHKKHEFISTETDNEGRFTLNNLAEGYTYSIDVVKSGYHYEISRAKAPEKGKTLLHNISIIKKVLSLVKVIDLNSGEPVPGVKIIIWEGKAGRSRWDHKHVASSNVDGEYQLLLKRGNRYEIEVDTEEYYTRRGLSTKTIGYVSGEKMEIVLKLRQIKSKR